MLFFLVESGLPAAVVYGYHDGWDFDRLHRAFLYFKSREIEAYKSNAVAVAVGASSIFKAGALTKFGRRAADLIEKLASDRRKMDPGEMEAEKQRQSDRVVAVFQQLAAFVQSKGRVLPS